MEEKARIWDSNNFRQRLGTFSHAAILMTLVTVWLIYLIDVLQPLFIALGIYFVLKPGADLLSSKGFPIMLSYITMLMLAILIVLSAGFFAYQQAAAMADDEGTFLTGFDTGLVLRKSASPIDDYDCPRPSNQRSNAVQMVKDIWPMASGFLKG